jgi:hypothetical protein
VGQVLGADAHGCHCEPCHKWVSHLGAAFALSSDGSVGLPALYTSNIYPGRCQASECGLIRQQGASAPGSVAGSHSPGRELPHRDVQCTRLPDWPAAALATLMHSHSASAARSCPHLEAADRK